MAREAALAESAGFEALWVGDHVALPLDLGEAAEVPRLEALVTLSYLAAATTRARLGVGVLVLPQRQPVLLAKQLSSIDILSRGRLTVGIGVGYVEGELKALGTPLAERGPRTDEYIAALRALWEGAAAHYTGRFVAFDSIVQQPRPVQRPHPPIVIGGHSPAAFRRAALEGDGWYGWQLGLDETAQSLARLRAAVDRHRPPGRAPLEITITPRGVMDLDTAGRYAELGVDRLALQPQTLDAAAMAELITMAGDQLIGRV
jgi:probable F420-dependent oxidoreductase